MADDPTPSRPKLRLLLIRIGIVLLVALAVLIGVSQGLAPKS